MVEKLSNFSPFLRLQSQTVSFFPCSRKKPIQCVPSPSTGEGQGGGDYFLLLLPIIIICLLMFAPSGNIKAEPSAHPATDLSHAVTLEWVQAKLSQNPKPILIDVRRPEEFEKFRIPDSINIPLHAIKTKPFLKDKSIVLLNEGFLYTPLAEEAIKLKKIGYSVSILYGGLNAWHKSKGEIQGNVFWIEEINRVSPQMFHQEKTSGSHRIIYISKEKTDRSLSGAINITGDSFGDLQAIQNSSQAENEFVTFSILNKNGTKYEESSKILASTKLLNVFFLQGGLMAYEQYRDELTVSFTPREERLVMKNACDTCTN